MARVLMYDFDGESFSVVDDPARADRIMRDPRRQLAVTPIAQGTPAAGWVSTVFLAFDHRWAWAALHNEGKPILWETMLFRDDVTRDDHLWQRRYASEEEARAGHQEAVAVLFALDQEGSQN